MGPQAVPGICRAASMAALLYSIALSRASSSSGLRYPSLGFPRRGGPVGVAAPPVKSLSRTHTAIAKLDADIAGMDEDQVAELLAQAEAHKAALEQWIAQVRGQLKV